MRTRDGAPYLHAFDLPNNNPQNTERFRAIHGVTYMISGGGGGERYPLAFGPQSVYAAARLNVLKVTASPQVMQVEALGADRGRVRPRSADPENGRCRRNGFTRRIGERKDKGAAMIVARAISELWRRAI